MHAREPQFNSSSSRRYRSFVNPSYERQEASRPPSEKPEPTETRVAQVSPRLIRAAQREPKVPQRSRQGSTNNAAPPSALPQQYRQQQDQQRRERERLHSSSPVLPVSQQSQRQQPDRDNQNTSPVPASARNLTFFRQRTASLNVLNNNAAQGQGQITKPNSGATRPILVAEASPNTSTSASPNDLSLSPGGPIVSPVVNADLPFLGNGSTTNGAFHVKGFSKRSSTNGDGDNPPSRSSVGSIERKRSSREQPSTYATTHPQPENASPSRSGAARVRLSPSRSGPPEKPGSRFFHCRTFNRTPTTTAAGMGIFSSRDKDSARGGTSCRSTNAVRKGSRGQAVSGDSFVSGTSFGNSPNKQGSVDLIAASVGTSLALGDARPRPPSAFRKALDKKDAGWEYEAPPNNQRTFFFAEDNIEFSSEFDSGNLIQVVRQAPYKYSMYTAMDCGNDLRQTNNRQWFHFSVRGGVRGSTVSVTVIGVLHSSMYTYEWMPVMAVLPNRPAYVRLPGRAHTAPLDAMPPTPDYPMLVYRDPAERRRALEGTPTEEGGGAAGADDASADENAPGGAEEDELDSGASPTDSSARGKDLPKKKKKKPLAMNLTFEFRLDHEVPLTSPHPLGHPECPAIYIASNHPYSYTTLQRNLTSWQNFAAGRAGARPACAPADKSGGVNGKVWNYTPNLSPAHHQDIYYHREVLCRTLEGRNVDLITISDMSGIVGGEKNPQRMPLLNFSGEMTPLGFPTSSARKQTTRPFRFVGKQYVVLSARVHAAECPGSHMMHGCIDFLMNPKDPRAMALRKHFVFFLVPMLNPDGVVRGHSRVDANGVDLNRMYRTPSYKRHPAAYSLWALLSTLAAEKKLSLYIDMHAHANKRGTFFYGNGMDAGPQVENLLYSKLVSLNTPYLEFKSCNYSESNMSAVTRSGLSKDCSCRVVLYTETGVIHSYAVEASHVAGRALNPIEPLAGIPGEEIETVATTRYSPATFGDTGKAMLLGLLDLKGLNPASRVPLSPYQSVKGISLWLQRNLQTELAEKLFAQAYKDHGRAEPVDATQTPVAAVLAQLTPEEIPEKVTVRNCRQLPPTTVSNITDFVPLDLAATLLAQTPAPGPPRSLLAAPLKRKATTSAARSPSTAAPPRSRAASPQQQSNGDSGAVSPQILFGNSPGPVDEIAAAVAARTQSGR